MFDQADPKKEKSKKADDEMKKCSTKMTSAKGLARLKKVETRRMPIQGQMAVLVNDAQLCELQIQQSYSNGEQKIENRRETPKIRGEEENEFINSLVSEVMTQFNEVDQSTFEFVLRVDRTGDGSAALRIEILRKNAAVPSA
ncbi:hypothetical protein WR25_21845 [Diploscapter pachys]|uniref:Uncharacterized protein n=1 Tax=Diploscapter pachys TaxID=2018661 RepID=A0A2A2LQQ1_9BILA|nr:hypothetical protein WR25_21845 [Diploscapter pachys]